jgi:signal recognition particle GTPase
MLGGHNMAEMVRVNTRISTKLNDWLDQQTEETGVPKSTQIMLALETYYQQREAMKSMGNMGAIVDMLNDIRSEMEKMKP